jgi:O-methyltransferase
MKKNIIQLNAFFKSFIYFLAPHYIFGFLKTPFLFFSNILSVSKWIRSQDKKDILDDFYTPVRDYNKREKLYQYIAEKHQLQNEPISYLEFGVASANSFMWWIKANNHPSSSFVGFDTFEGLPEDWGFMFNKGDMKSHVPILEDKRCKFVKGLFQDTLFDFTRSANFNNNHRKVIHMDADLFTATLFSLTTLAPYLKKGDIILFDEFNSPNHEYFAWDIFTKSYYVKAKLIGAVNNYFQVGFEIL